MRKVVKNQLIDLCESILRVEELLWSLDDNSQKEILGNCQEAAVVIGNILEQSGYNQWVPVLEEYCEDLYKEFIGASDIKEIRTSRVERINYVYKEIDMTTPKIEVAFFPYKASMWDCMESIWASFSSDSNCSVHVVPISYFEFDRVDKRAKECYEGDCFPAHVPVESYQQYRLGESKPDIAFIHNPYDECNIVTSVNPVYYSSNLKKYVNKLVYVPYYVTGGAEPDSHSNLPVYRNMDYIVIQSKQMIERYVEMGIDKKKILALGTAKLDAVRYAEENDRVPEAWKKKIAGRPVYFLNTSISGLLEKDIIVLQRTEEVIALFEKRTDCVLLWRPHPLLLTTIRAMRPALQEKFEKMLTVDNVENIIIDQTTDISRAVAISQAYIGEESSSIVHLFGALGKPVFLLDMSENKVEKCDKPIEFMGFELENDICWFSDCGFNALCKMDMRSGATEIVNHFAGESDEGQRLYNICRISDKELYFAPLWGREEAFYDIERDVVLKQKIGGEESLFYGTNFVTMFKIQDSVYMIPTRYPAILKYNIKERKYDRITKWREEANIGKDITICYDAAVVENRYIYMPYRHENVLWILDSNTDEVERYHVDELNSGFCAIAAVGNDLWIATADGKEIIVWNKKEGIIHRINNYSEEYKIEDAFLSLICCEKYVYVIPRKIGKVLRVRKDNYDVFEFDLYEDGVDFTKRKENIFRWPNSFYFAKSIGNTKFMAMRAYDAKVVIYDEENEKREYLTPYYSAKYGKEKFTCCGLNLPYAIRENKYIGIEDFVEKDFSYSKFDKEVAIQEYAKVIDNISSVAGEIIKEKILEIV